MRRVSVSRSRSFRRDPSPRHPENLSVRASAIPRGDRVTLHSRARGRHSADVTPRAIMYPTVRNVGRGNTRCKRKKFHRATHAQAGARSAERRIVESTCVGEGRRLLARRIRALAPDRTELNEFTAEQALLRGQLHVRYDDGDDGYVGMRTLTLVRTFVLHGAWRTLHGPPAMHRIEDKRALGGATLHRCMTV